LVREKQFREDLFYRLNVLRVHLPPLRERQGDIALLARHFVEEICAAGGVPKKVFSPASICKLEEHDWPGNVRELYNTVQRAAFAAPGTQIASAHINFSRFQSTFEAKAEDFRSAKTVAIEKFERGYVDRLLEKYAGNITSLWAPGEEIRSASGVVAGHRSAAPGLFGPTRNNCFEAARLRTTALQCASSACHEQIPPA
jgi:DNA-binding NtrC family response regulator